jgi:hypothetical protein
MSFSKLFEDIIENGNIVKSYLELDKLKTNFYYKDSKRTFEEAFDSIVNKLNTKPKLKADFLRKTAENTRREAGKELNKSESEMIFNQVIKDLYLAKKKAFEFND